MRSVIIPAGLGLNSRYIGRAKNYKGVVIICELLALSFNKPVRPRFSFKSFICRGESNPHGWGLAFYPSWGKAVQVIKEPGGSHQSPLAEYVSEYSEICSRTIISHIRYQSSGSDVFASTHPFQREYQGRDYAFAHNGTLTGFRSLPLERFHPIGDTDSEYVFCYLLGAIAERGLQEWTENDMRWLGEILRKINYYGDFNCLFSNGEYLFCYHDQNNYKGLCFTNRSAPYGPVQLEDSELEIDLSEEKDLEQTGFIVATRKLTKNEHWINFCPGELMVLKSGCAVYSNMTGSKELKILETLRRSEIRVSLEKIADSLRVDIDDTKELISSLVSKKFIKQDSRDEVDQFHRKATYYTRRSKRDEIDRRLELLS